MGDTVDLSWSQLTRWRRECYQRFGSIRDLPLRSLHQELQELLRSDSCLLDIGAGVHKPLKQSLGLPTQHYRLHCVCHPYV